MSIPMMSNPQWLLDAYVASSNEEQKAAFETALHSMFYRIVRDGDRYYLQLADQVLSYESAQYKTT